MNFGRRLFSSLIALSSAFVLGSTSGCGKSPSIMLKSATLPAPSLPSDKPGDGTDGSDTGSGTDSHPTGGSSVQPQNGSRLVCVAGDQGRAVTLSSLLHGGEAGRDVAMVQTTRPASEITHEMENLLGIQAPHLVRPTADDHVQVLFMSRQLKHADPSGDLNLYTADLDVSNGTGKATLLGPAAAISAGARQAASSLGFALRNYGSSSRGNYLIVPGGNGLRVLRASNMKPVGTFALSSASTFSPTIDEDSQTFSALVSSGGGLVPVIYHVNLKSGVALGAKIASGTAGRLSGPAVADGDGGYFWGETAQARSSNITLVHVSSNGHVDRAVYQAPVSGARIFPQVAVYSDSGNNVVAVAYERVTASGNRAHPYTVQAALVSLTLSGGRVSDVGSTDYDGLIIENMNANGWGDSNFAISTLVNSYDRSEVMFQAQVAFGTQLFRYAGGMVTQLANNLCTQLDVLELAR